MMALGGHTPSLLMWRRRHALGGGAPAWSPGDLGATLLTWLEADPDYLYQASGPVEALAVTADTNPVGFVRDKSQELGPELVTNADFTGSFAAWDPGGAGDGTAVQTNGTAVLSSAKNYPGDRAWVRQNLTAAAGVYLCTIDVASSDASFSWFLVGTAQGASNLSGNGRWPAGGSGTSETLVNHPGGSNLFIEARVSGSAVINSISIKRAPGIHATQATSSARPLYRTGAGLPYLQFDGTDDGLGLALAATSARNFYFLMRTADANGLLAHVDTGLFAGAWQNSAVAPHGGFSPPAPTYVVDGVATTTRQGIFVELTDDQWSVVEIRGLVSPAWTSTNLFNYGSSFTVDGDLAAYLATDAATETTQDRDNIRAYLQGLIP